MAYQIRPALIMIDLQNGFLSEGGSFDKLGYDISKYRQIMPKLLESYDQAKALNIPVIFTMAVREESGIDMLEKDHQILPQKRRERMEKFPLCVKGSWDAELIDEFKQKIRDLVLLKRRDSAFQNTELELWLKSLEVDTLVFAGVDTSICVESSLRDGFNRGWDVILLSDLTASLNDHFYQTTLDEVNENYGLVLGADQFFKKLKKQDQHYLLQVSD
jgi:ureidoacrylate peracid hydrolase